MEPGENTIHDWLAQPSERRFELIDGEFIEKAPADMLRALPLAGVVATLHGAFHRKAASGLGGWWIAPGVDIQLGANGYRPDIAGWKRENLSERTQGRPVTLRPDWICEVLSDTNRHNDTIRKLRRYHEAGVPHYWLLDPDTGTLNVFRNEPQGYLSVLIADRNQRVRAEPFESIEILVGVLLGDDPE